MDIEIVLGFWLGVVTTTVLVMIGASLLGTYFR